MKVPLMKLVEIPPLYKKVEVNLKKREGDFIISLSIIIRSYKWEMV